MKIFCILQGICLIIFLWCVSIAVVFQEKIFLHAFTVIGLLEILIIVSSVLLINTDKQLSIE
jgi:hypothetical protein